MIGGIVDLCGPNPDKFRVQAVNIINSGFGYTVAPSVIFNGGGGKDASAIATIGDGVIQNVNIINGGSGYVGVVTVSFVGIASLPAEGRAIIENGSIKSIVLSNTGYGYTQTPSVVISSPIFVGVGTYQYNEIVAGSATSYTARVRSWDATSKLLQVANPTGTFAQDEIILGTESGAQYKVEISSYGDNITDEYASNIDIQEESDKIIDFSEKNPFGIF
jgi:hypothetical protein